MKTFLDSRRHYRAATVPVFLIALALMAGATACNDTYQLTISSTAGGSVTTPREGTLTYDAGTVVELVSTADDGYHFAGWSGDTQSIASRGSASTTITMNADYIITANFRKEGERGPIPIEPCPPIARSVHQW